MISFDRVVDELRFSNEIDGRTLDNPEYLRGQVEFAAVFCESDDDLEATRLRIYAALGVPEL